MTRRFSWSSGFIIGALASTTLLVAIVGRQALEASMFTHMLLQMPLLILSGVLLSYVRFAGAGRWYGKLQRLRASCDAHGLASMPGLLFCSAYWMVPNALERAVANASDDIAKCLSLMIAGLLLPYFLRKSHVVVQIFFVGNFAWMMAIAGITYQDTPQRLCNSYLLTDQVDTGIALVVLAIVLPLWWGAAQLHAFAKQNGDQQRRVLDSQSGVGHAAFKEQHLP